MGSYIFLVSILYISNTWCVRKELDTKYDNANNNKADIDDTPTIFLKQSHDGLNNNSVHVSSNETVKVPNTDSVAKSSEDESGAMMRGVFVFVGIGLLFIIYLGCKTYRRKKPVIMIKKYGVMARRSDVEMEPLPLAEEEEEYETLFDVKNINRT